MRGLIVAAAIGAGCYPRQIYVAGAEMHCQEPPKSFAEGRLIGCYMEQSAPLRCFYELADCLLVVDEVSCGDWKAKNLDCAKTKEPDSPEQEA